MKKREEQERCGEGGSSRQLEGRGGKEWMNHPPARSLGLSPEPHTPPERVAKATHSSKSPHFSTTRNMPHCLTSGSSQSHIHWRVSSHLEGAEGSHLEGAEGNKGFSRRAWQQQQQALIVRETKGIGAIANSVQVRRVEGERIGGPSAGQSALAGENSGEAPPNAPQLLYSRYSCNRQDQSGFVRPRAQQAWIP